MRKVGASVESFLRQFEIEQAGHRVLPMEGLRGLAVTLVFFVHYCGLMRPYVEGIAVTAARVLQIVGDTGVDLFFVLSGYLIYGGLVRRAQPFIPYIRRRIQRIYPTFATMLTIYCLLSLFIPSTSKIPLDLSEAFLFIAANALLLPGVFEITPIITVAWSLSYEMFFYLAIPFIIWVGQLRRWTSRSRILVFVVIAILWKILSIPHVRFGMFICGMVLAEAIRNDPHVRRRWLDFACPIAIALSSLALLSEQFNSLSFYVLFITFFLLCYSAFTQAGVVSSILSLRCLRLLGNMSYSYYLAHGLVLQAVFYFFNYWPVHLSPGAFWLLLIPMFALTVVGSMPLFLMVERPFSVVPGLTARSQSGPTLYRPAR